MKNHEAPVCEVIQEWFELLKEMMPGGPVASAMMYAVDGAVDDALDFLDANAERQQEVAAKIIEAGSRLADLYGGA